MRFAISTPTTSAVEIGPFTIHFYALCIIAGVALAIWLGNRRFTNSHANVDGVVADVAIYLIRLAQVMNIDLINAIRNKIEVNSLKYPIETSKGNATKYSERENH